MEEARATKELDISKDAKEGVIHVMVEENNVFSVEDLRASKYVNEALDNLYFTCDACKRCLYDIELLKKRIEKLEDHITFKVTSKKSFETDTITAHKYVQKAQEYAKNEKKEKNYFRYF